MGRFQVPPASWWLVAALGPSLVSGLPVQCRLHKLPQAFGHPHLPESPSPEPGRARSSFRRAVCQESQKQVARVFRLWIPQSVPFSR